MLVILYYHKTQYNYYLLLLNRKQILMYFIICFIDLIEHYNNKCSEQNNTINYILYIIYYDNTFVIQILQCL